MGEIQQGRYDRLLRRTTAQVGPGSKVGNALEDLFPTLDVENAPMELLRASGWDFGMGRIANTAVAGQVNSFQLFNPVGSGMLMALTSLRISSSVDTVFQYGPSFAVLADTSAPGAQRDTRDGSIRASVGLLQEQDNGVASAFGMVQVLANLSLELIDPNGLAVLAPGTGFRINDLTVATVVRSGWMWRERVAEPEELNF